MKVPLASHQDVASLRAAGFQVDKPLRYGESEKAAAFRKARVTRDTRLV